MEGLQEAHLSEISLALGVTLAELIDEQFVLLEVGQLNYESGGVAGLGNGLSEKLLDARDVEIREAVEILKAEAMRIGKVS